MDSEQDLHNGRRVLIWEITQAVVAIMVVMTTMCVAAWEAVANMGEQIPTIISGAFFLVVGFYFSRTTHAAEKPGPPIEGR